MGKHGVEIVKLRPGDAKRFIDLAEEKLWAKILKQSPENGARLQKLFAAA